MITYTIAALLFKKQDEGLNTAVSALKNQFGNFTAVGTPYRTAD